jgi:hypothetical protein
MIMELFKHSESRACVPRIQILIPFSGKDAFGLKLKEVAKVLVFPKEFPMRQE